MHLEDSVTDVTISGLWYEEEHLFINASTYHHWCQCYLVMLQFGRNAGDLASKLIETDQTFV